MKITQELLTEIILQGKLSSFILGEEEFLSYRPADDYSRWGELQRFYASLKFDSPLKNKIDNTIVDLYSEPNTFKKHTAIAVGRLLQIPSIKQKIIDAINLSEFQNYEQSLQNEFLFSATILQLFEVSGLVVKKFCSDRRLGEFLLCSSVPPYVEWVGEDDIWRIKVLEAFFEDSSDETRESIHNQVRETARYSRNFRLAIQQYLARDENIREFHLILEKVIIQYLS